MVFWMVAIWVGAVVLAFWVVASLFPQASTLPRLSPREIARTRYARGELTAPQLREILAALD